MSLTFIGLIQFAIGMLLLVRGSLGAMFVFTLLSGLFGGSASLIVTAAGNSSLPPIQFALLFLLLRILLPSAGLMPQVVQAVRANGLLLAFTFYGIASAIIAPRIFAGTIDVAPLRFIDPRSLFDTVPLEPTTQNLTSAIYLLNTLLITLAAYVACRQRGGAATLVRGMVATGWAHVGLGLFGLAVHGTPAEVVIDVLRNGSYAQLDQSYQGFVRIAGVFAEASSYAAFGLSVFFFTFECWYRNVLPRATGPVTMALGVVLVFSTSSTAYVGLAAYALFLLLRMMVLPTQVPVDRLWRLAIAGIAGTAGASAVMLAFPALANALVDMFLHMTVDKRDSLSGQQRLFWAMQGWTGFTHSWGLGIGAGSFRSSSLMMAILGSAGLIGIGTFLAYVIQVLKPLRASTWGIVRDFDTAVAAASACAALAVLVPASISAPSSNPGTAFAVFAGAALALRAAPRRLAARDMIVTMPAEAYVPGE